MTETPEITNAKSKKILLIDLDTASYFLISELLSDYGFEITHTIGGLEAIDLLCTDMTIDMVITELVTLDMDGFSTLAEIRKIKPVIPVIAQTARVFNNMRHKCLSAGFNEFMEKPINLNLFMDTVNRYFSGYKANTYHGMESSSGIPE